MQHPVKYLPTNLNMISPYVDKLSKVKYFSLFYIDVLFWTFASSLNLIAIKSTKRIKKLILHIYLCTIQYYDIKYNWYRFCCIYLFHLKIIIQKFILCIDDFGRFLWLLCSIYDVLGFKDGCVLEDPDVFDV